MSDERTEDGMILALGALSEVLTQQNTFLKSRMEKQEKDDEEEEEKKNELQKAFERDTLVAEVIKQIKKQDSKEKEIVVSSKPEEQQKVIQAAENQDEYEEKEVEKEEDEKDAEKDKEYPEVEKLRKENAELKKGIDKKVNKAIEDRMRKMGWKEEKGLVAPKRVELGAEEALIRKATDPEDKIAEMAKLDYATLKRLEIQSETDDLSPEIKQFLA